MKKLVLNMVAAVLTVVGLGAIATVSPANAATIYCPDGTVSTTGDLSGCANISGGNNTNDLMTTLNTVINVIVGMVGFVAVVMIIMGGISFATSQGDAGKTTKARNTILYGVVGLVVSLLAFAVVNFVLTNLF